MAMVIAVAITIIMVIMAFFAGGAYIGRGHRALAFVFA